MGQAAREIGNHESNSMLPITPDKATVPVGSRTCIFASYAVSRRP